MKLQLKLDEDERIIDVKFKTYGCGSAIASSSMFVDLLLGKTIEEAKQIKDKEIVMHSNCPSRYTVPFLQKVVSEEQYRIGKIRKRVVTKLG